MIDNCESNTSKKHLPKCPECKKEGKSVPMTVVRNLLHKNILDKIQEDDFYICMNPNCIITYFSDSKSFTIQDVRKPIWFKRGCTPKIACYCNNLTYAEVKSAVIEHGLTTWDEIVSNYRDNKTCECKKFNPTGECCREQNFYDVVNQALEFIDEEKIDIDKE